MHGPYNGTIVGRVLTYQNFYTRWCVDYKKCINDDGSIPVVDTKNVFLFYIYGKPETNLFGCAEGDRACILDLCKNPLGSTKGAVSCSTLLQMDGWEIKDDYPWF